MMVNNIALGPKLMLLAGLLVNAAPTLRNAANTGPAPASFAITGGPCTATTVLAASGGNCTINVRYTPPNTTTTSARAQITGTGAAATTQTGPTFDGN